MVGSTRCRTALVWSLVLALAGCGAAAGERPDTPSSSPAPDPRVPAERDASPWTACYANFAPTGDAKDDLSRLVRDCGAMGGMKPITGVKVGKQADEDPVDRFTFEVPEGGKCYRVYAAADASVKDLDLLLRGPTGPALADVSNDAWPVLPPAQPACFPAAGVYLLEVSVHQGSGRYALQVWGR